MSCVRNLCVRCGKVIRWTKVGMKRAVIVRRTKNMMEVACTTHCYLNYINGKFRHDNLNSRLLNLYTEQR